MPELNSPGFIPPYFDYCPDNIVEGKSNEIPAVQQLISELDIQNCMVVADALNCQRETAEVIIQGHGDYLLDAKGNQATLER